MRHLAAALSICIDGMIFYVLARSLFGGRMPLIGRLAVLFRGGDLPPKVAAYARRITQAWALLFGAFALATVLAAVHLLPAAVLYVTIAGKGPLCAALLLLEYGFRRVYLHELPHPSLGEFLRFLQRADYRAVLRD